ncbi:lysine-specific demethylase 2A-like [Clavelina lepadiformis]|uniref:lysine-specific demethylase 2A-like n=1 Tax=Clavelina lepadiformis TaxID=159417 RepID=UPI00404372A6
MSDRNLRHKTVPVYDDDDAVEDEIDGKRTYDVQDKVKSAKFNADFLLDLEGHELTFERIQTVGMSDPIRIKNKEGLGLIVPDSNSFSVSDVRAFVGGRRVVDVMECKTQRALEMSMREFENYFEGSERKYIYNVISLEFSQSKLASLVKRPKVVDCLDWIDLVWPQHLKHIQTEQTNNLNNMKYPKVQKYCLMSVAGCYTDFHIDFGGTSVWYHILKGGKIFWLIPPTNENLNLYERWTMSGNQGDIFFGDMVSRCQRIELEAGNSLMIPSGWIHAVYTSLDSIVFGGNFLNSFNIPMQLRIAQVEERLKVPNRFRFPFFSEVLWYALERYIHTLTHKSFLNNDFQEKNMLHLKKKEEESAKEEKIEDDSSSDHVHLTPFEYKGLQKLIETLEYLPKTKRNIPEGISQPEELLEAGKSLLWQHSGDDIDLAVTGKPKAFWPVPLKSKEIQQKIIRKPKPFGTPVAGKKPGVGRVRRVRCKQCEACLSDDCRSCVFCRDMRKYGGPGTMKQTCIKRRCTNPILPSTVREEPPTPTSAAPPRDETSSKPGRRGKRKLSGNEVETAVKMIKPEEVHEESEDESPCHRSQLPAVVISRVSTGDLMKYAVRPAVVSINDNCSSDPQRHEKLGLDRRGWMMVFRYLNHKDLFQCMTVCKDFLKWCTSPVLWRNIDLTGKRVTSATLQCLVRRTPTSLNLSQTNISYKQLLWLLERSPSLRELFLIRCSWSSVSALHTASCPPIRVLDLSWTAGFTDSHLKNLLSVPTDTRPGQEVSHTRLQFCHELSVAGTDISDAGLKLVSSCLPHLKTINISFCMITTEGLSDFIEQNNATTTSMSCIIAQHCPLMRNNALLFCTKLEKVKELDFRGCKNISEEACQELVSNSKFMLKMEEPLYIVAASKPA